jgi:hypothetical protein
VVGVLLAAACDGGTDPAEMGPVAFWGTVYSGEYRGLEEPRFAGVEVRGRVLRGDATNGCAGGEQVGQGTTTSSARGEYGLTFPLEEGVAVCVRLEAWKDGAVVARGAVEGFVYDGEPGGFVGADLMPNLGFTVVIMPIRRP